MTGVDVTGLPPGDQHTHVVRELAALPVGYAAVHPAGLPDYAYQRLQDRYRVLTEHQPVDMTPAAPLCAAGDPWPCPAYRQAENRLVTGLGNHQPHPTPTPARPAPFRRRP